MLKQASLILVATMLCCYVANGKSVIEEKAIDELCKTEELKQGLKG